MNILFAIQGTGNGHLSRAISLLPELKKHGKVKLLVSGANNGLKLPFPVSYRFHGLGFSFGKSGGIDFARTFTDAKIYRLIKEFESVPVEKFDLVINDFEPLTAWACKSKQVPCIGLSHQSALLHPGVPLPETPNLFGSLILRHYAPTAENISFHFAAYHPDIFTPVIREDLRRARATDKGHITVYLPAYGDAFLINFFKQLKDVPVHIFSRSGKSTQVNPYITVKPVDQQAFGRSLLSSRAVVCGAGFETPAEALFLGKKLLVVPMKNQYEQQCNATALEQLGVQVVLQLLFGDIGLVRQWFEERSAIQLSYPQLNKEIFEAVIEKYHRMPKKPANSQKTQHYLRLMQGNLNSLRSRAVRQIFSIAD